MPRSSNSKPEDGEEGQSNEQEKEAGEGREESPPASPKGGGGGSEADKKSDEPKADGSSSSEDDFIKLRVVGADQNEVLFKIKVSTQMYKLKNSYSARMGLPVGTLRFLFDGRRISDDETPKQLDMKNGDMLEVYQEQMGGRRHC